MDPKQRDMIIGTHGSLVSSSHNGEVISGQNSDPLLGNGTLPYPPPMITGRLKSSSLDLPQLVRQAVMVANGDLDEPSQPPSPKEGFPPNFATVEEGIYRSSYPRAENLDCLRGLGLKTVMTLVTEQDSVESRVFISEQGIKHVKLLIPAHKTPVDFIPSDLMAEALQVLFDPTNHPILVHCNKGKHRTGCIIACYRTLSDWTLDSTITEYRKYAGTKARPLDEQYIRAFDRHAMALRLNDAVYKTIGGRHGLPTPPSSDKDVFVDGDEESDPDAMDTPTVFPKTVSTFTPLM